MFVFFGVLRRVVPLRRIFRNFINSSRAPISFPPFGIQSGIGNKQVRFFISVPQLIDIKSKFKEGNDYFHQENFIKAIQCYNDVIQYSPNDERPYYNKACALQKQGHVAIAIEFFNKAISLNPKLHNARLNKAICLMELHHYSDAIEELYTLIENEPFIAHINLGFCYEHLQQEDRSLHHFKHALLHDSENCEVYYHMAKIYFEKTEYSEALDCINKVLSAESLPEYLFLKSKILEKLGRDEDRNLVNHQYLLSLFSNPG